MAVENAIGQSAKRTHADNFSLNDTTWPVGEVNTLVDELLVIIELLIAEDDICHSVPAWFLG